MEQEQKLNEALNRIARIRLWEGRLAQMEISEAAFCRKYRIHQSQLCRAKKPIHVPRPPLFERIERALQNEGV